MVTNTKKSAETKESSSEELKSAPEAQDSNIVEGSETSEFVDGLPSEASEKPAEKQSEDKKGSGGSSSQNSTGGNTQFRKLVIPPRNTMRKQVRAALEEEETKLIKAAKHYTRKGEYSKANDALSGVRAIRQTLSDLVRATLDSMKSLWMKYVYNKRKAQG